MGLMQKCSGWAKKYGFLDLLGAVLSRISIVVKHRPHPR